MTKRASWVAEKRVGDLVHIVLDEGMVLEGVIKGWLDERRRPCFRGEACYANIYTLNGSHRGAIVPVPTGATSAQARPSPLPAAPEGTGRRPLHRTCVADVFAEDERAGDRGSAKRSRSSRRTGDRNDRPSDRGQRARDFLLPVWQRLRHAALAH